MDLSLTLATVISNRQSAIGNRQSIMARQLAKPWRIEMDTFIQDIRFGLRVLRKNPGFTAAAVVTLALSIGANAAIFDVINGVLLKPLPYKEPDRIVRVFENSPRFPRFPT